MAEEITLKLKNVSYEEGMSAGNGGGAMDARADFELTINGEKSTGRVELLLSNLQLGALVSHLAGKKEE